MMPASEIFRQLSYLPQNPNMLLFAQTVEGELEFTLQNYNKQITQRKRTEIIQELLDFLEIKHYHANYPRDLSTGERQRVALGAVTITNPQVLLLDEPTRGIDPHLKQNLSALLKKWRDNGMAILIATHDVELAAEIADQVFLLKKGRLIDQGTPARVMHQNVEFQTQVAKLFPDSNWLTVSDAVQGLTHH
jgi:energy-coupling factor transport system ATP-binding protein